MVTFRRGALVTLEAVCCCLRAFHAFYFGVVCRCLLRRHFLELRDIVLYSPHSAPPYNMPLYDAVLASGEAAEYIVPLPLSRAAQFASAAFHDFIALRPTFQPFAS